MKKRKLPKKLNNMSILQMKTLVSLHNDQHFKSVADELNRDQTSVRKSIEDVNSYFKEICGEVLVKRPPKGTKGEPVIFTSAGEKVVSSIKKFLRDYEYTIEEARRREGRKLTAASTSGMLFEIADIWPKWQEKARNSFTLELTQIRTNQLDDYLSNNKADLIFTGLLTIPLNERKDEDFDFIKWERHDVNILSNKPNIVNTPLRKEDISEGRADMILPTHGVVRTFADIYLGRKITNAPNVSVLAWIDDIHFGLGLLRNNIYKGCMFAVDPIAEKLANADNIKEGAQTELYKYELECPDDLGIATGLFRRSDCDEYSDNHPINICWNIFKQKAKKKNTAQ